VGIAKPSETLIKTGFQDFNFLNLIF